MKQPKISPPAASEDRIIKQSYQVETADASASMRLVDPNDQNPFGTADVEDMLSVAYDSLGEDPEIDTPWLGIAIQAIAKAVSARIRNDAYTSDSKTLSVFMVTERPRSEAGALAADREPIADNGSLSFAGCFWITGPAFKSAYRRLFTATTPAGIFCEVENLGLGDRPVFVFDPNATDLELRYYPRGLSDTETVQSFLISQHEFSIEALDRVLQRFYETSIRTPDSKLGREGPWNDPEKYIPRPDTEAFLQNWLKIAVNAFFQSPFSCEFEKPGNEGRCDLMLVSRHPTQKNTQIHHAVMELKVLRSRTSGNNPVSATARETAIEGGLKQAIAYKNEQNAAMAMLCCFDMRTVSHCDDNNCFSSISERAKASDIELRRYRLYGSSADFRAEQYG